KLADKEETQKFCHLDAPIEPVHIIEDGAVRTVAEAVFTYNSARAVVKYIMSQNEPLKVSVRIIWDEKQKMVKMNIPAAFGAKECIGQQPYGCEVLKDDMTENVSQEYIVFASEDKAMLAVNNGTYGSSFDRNNGMLKLTLLRSPAYCTHPLPNLNPVPQDRYISYIDQGERDFELLFDIGARETILNNAGRTAQHFNMRPMLLSFYPDCGGKRQYAPAVISDNDIINMTSFKRSDDGRGYIVRLFNPTEQVQTASIKVCGVGIDVSFDKYEIKTVYCENGVIKECEMKC
ncbi:MAG: glycoside hydrolase family 38 C-terminal domain-containing protein, partial [Clostridiales bacterium]|nr:glycoside hydrolase family 38 C-terminal domain-containing protein [Clostridiales bacterium]